MSNDAIRLSRSWSGAGTVPSVSATVPKSNGVGAGGNILNGVGAGLIADSAGDGPVELGVGASVVVRGVGAGVACNDDGALTIGTGVDVEVGASQGGAGVGGTIPGSAIDDVGDGARVAVRGVGGRVGGKSVVSGVVGIGVGVMAVVSVVGTGVGGEGVGAGAVRLGAVVNGVVVVVAIVLVVDGEKISGIGVGAGAADAETDAAYVDVRCGAEVVVDVLGEGVSGNGAGAGVQAFDANAGLDVRCVGSGSGVGGGTVVIEFDSGIDGHEVGASGKPVVVVVVDKNIGVGLVGSRAGTTSVFDMFCASCRVAAATSAAFSSWSSACLASKNTVFMWSTEAGHSAMSFDVAVCVASNLYVVNSMQAEMKSPCCFFSMARKSWTPLPDGAPVPTVLYAEATARTSASARSKYVRAVALHDCAMTASRASFPQPCKKTAITATEAAPTTTRTAGAMRAGRCIYGLAAARGGTASTQRLGRRAEALRLSQIA